MSEDNYDYGLRRVRNLNVNTPSYLFGLDYLQFSIRSPEE